MSRTFEKLLNGLQDIRSEKLCELDGLFGAHQSWLTEIVENVQGRIEAFRGPPGKRRRVDARALEKLKHILGAVRVLCQCVGGRVRCWEAEIVGWCSWGLCRRRDLCGYQSLNAPH